MVNGTNGPPPPAPNPSGQGGPTSSGTNNNVGKRVGSVGGYGGGPQPPPLFRKGGGPMGRGYGGGPGPGIPSHGGGGMYHGDGGGNRPFGSPISGGGHGPRGPFGSGGRGSGIPPGGPGGPLGPGFHHGPGPPGGLGSGPGHEPGRPLGHIHGSGGPGPAGPGHGPNGPPGPAGGRMIGHGGPQEDPFGRRRPVGNGGPPLGFGRGTGPPGACVPPHPGFDGRGGGGLNFNHNSPGPPHPGVGNGFGGRGRDRPFGDAPPNGGFGRGVGGDRPFPPDAPPFGNFGPRGGGGGGGGGDRPLMDTQPGGFGRGGPGDRPFVDVPPGMGLRGPGDRPPSDPPPGFGRGGGDRPFPPFLGGPNGPPHGMLGPGNRPPFDGPPPPVGPNRPPFGANTSGPFGGPPRPEGCATPLFGPGGGVGINRGGDWARRGRSPGGNAHLHKGLQNQSAQTVNNITQQNPPSSPRKLPPKSADNSNSALSQSQKKVCCGPKTGENLPSGIETSSPNNGESNKRRRIESDPENTKGSLLDVAMKPEASCSPSKNCSTTTTGSKVVSSTCHESCNSSSSSPPGNATEMPDTLLRKTCQDPSLRSSDEKSHRRSRTEDRKLENSSDRKQHVRGSTSFAEDSKSLDNVKQTVFYSPHDTSKTHPTNEDSTDGEKISSLPKLTSQPTPMSPDTHISKTPRPVSPPTGPPSALGLALARLADLTSQMEFAYAKQMVLNRKHEVVKAQIKLLESLPVGVEAFRDELDEFIRKGDESKENITCEAPGE